MMSRLTREHRDKGISGSVWMYDPFCFTPWYTARLATALSASGVNMRLVCSSFVREPEYFSRCGLKRDPGPLLFSEAMFSPRFARRALRTSEVLFNTSILTAGLRAGSTKPRLLHLQQMPLLDRGVTLDFYLIGAAKLAGVPVVHTVHNVLPHAVKPSHREIYARLYDKVKHLICHSESASIQLQNDFSIPPDRITIIPHGPLFDTVTLPTTIDCMQARERLALPLGRPIVLWQGVLARYKGIDVLLDAWDFLCRGWADKDGPRPLLVIAGDGPRSQVHMVASAAARHAADIRAELRYISTSELPDFYKAADLLVYPHRAVTTSGALLTGLSYCKPILASHLACFTEYLIHAENALLIKPEDPALLASGLHLLLSSRGQGSSVVSPMATLQRGALRNRERYVGWSSIAATTKALYDRLTDQGDGPCVPICNPLHTPSAF